MKKKEEEKNPNPFKAPNSPRADTMALDPPSVQNKNPILCGQAVFVVKEQKTYDVLKEKKNPHFLPRRVQALGFLFSAWQTNYRAITLQLASQYSKK